MSSDNINFLYDVAEYYDDMLQKHGQTPKGVDWNNAEVQALRFKQLCKIINSTSHFSLNDLGCGYGALYDFLSAQYKSFSYIGIDVSKNMIQAAKERYQDNAQVFFFLSNVPKEIEDYGIASGIFNVRLGKSDKEWWSYCEEILGMLNQTSRLGFAFNCLTSYSEKDKMRDYLYYADPCTVFDLCKRKYSPNVCLLHDYGLYEFTILVRK